MLIQIREIDNIKGINIGNYDIKLSAFADDTYFLTLDTQSLRHILKTCSVFENYSSLKLNLDKSQGCWIGAAKGKLDKPLECGWINIEREKILVLGIYLSYNQSLVENCNFLNMLSCIKESLNLWECRRLTLAGRIQIFKSLALSKTIYASTMIIPSKKFMDQLYSLQKDFIWRERPPKIKHTLLIADYVDGGYKDIDIATKLEPLKIMWIKCMLDNNFHMWKAIPYTYDIQKLFHNNFQPSQTCKKEINLYPKFYQELISLWEKVCIKEPVDIAEVLSQPIWNNHFLQKQDSTLFYSELYRRGVLSIRDIVDKQGKFLTWCLAKEKYGLQNQHLLPWLSVIETVPQKWKQQIKRSKDTVTNDLLQNKVVPIMAVKEVYKKLLNKIIKPPTAQRTIEAALQSTDINWPKVYMIPQKVTIDTTLRIFQFKILNNILYLNKRISKFDLNVSPLCSLCDQHPEDILHLFCKCAKPQDLWNSLASVLVENLDLPQLNPTIVFLGESNVQDNDNVLLNHILLLFKKFIYDKKNHPGRIHFLSFMNYVKEVEKIEQNIAHRKGKLEFHFKKWNPIKHLL